MFRLSSNLLAALAVLSAFSAASPTPDTDVESIAEPLPVADAGIISGTVEVRADISASFNTFKGDNCGDANFLQTHNPKQAKVCHKLAANEKSLDVYFVKSGCTCECFSFTMTYYARPFPRGNAGIPYIDIF